MSAKGFSVSLICWDLTRASRLGSEMSVGVQKERWCFWHIFLEREGGGFGILVWVG